MATRTKWTTTGSDLTAVPLGGQRPERSALRRASSRWRQPHLAREFERRTPGARLAVIPDCGHVSNLQAPRAFNDIVRSFLHDHG